jgi:N-acetylneuraminic acid mutarotase
LRTLLFHVVVISVPRLRCPRSTKFWGFQLLIYVTLSLFAGLRGEETPFRWKELPVIPDPVGFAGMFAGVSGKGIIAAGGHRFADGVPWWDGGTKVWSDVVYVYSAQTSRWRVASTSLPRPLGDGACVSFDGEVICAGGGDAERAYAEVFSLRETAGRVDVTALPPLPGPCVRMGGALVGTVIYIVGGREHPTTGAALRTFWALDLAGPPSTRRWRSLPPWPGPPRMMPVVASVDGSLFVFGGIEVVVDTSGRAVNRAPYLQDAYRYRPGTADTEGAWETLPLMPQPNAGAPSPAWTPDASSLVIFGGVDGVIEAITDRSSVRSLPDSIFRFDVTRRAWSVIGQMPPTTARVNAPAVVWNGDYYIVAGEHLPARRTNAVTRVTRAASAPR